MSGIQVFLPGIIQWDPLCRGDQAMQSRMVILMDFPLVHWVGWWYSDPCTWCGQTCTLSTSLIGTSSTQQLFNTFSIKECPLITPRFVSSGRDGTLQSNIHMRWIMLLGQLWRHQSSWPLRLYHFKEVWNRQWPSFPSSSRCQKVAVLWKIPRRTHRGYRSSFVASDQPGLLSRHTHSHISCKARHWKYVTLLGNALREGHSSGTFRRLLLSWSRPIWLRFKSLWLLCISGGPPDLKAVDCLVLKSILEPVTITSKSLAQAFQGNSYSRILED